MSPRGYALKESDLLPLSLGAALLGTGGGGNPYIGMLQGARTACARAAQSRSCRSRPFGTTTIIGSVGGIGAPVVSVEKIKQGQECLRALRGVEEAMNVRVSALISAEVGGSNSIEPILTAAYAGLPVVDGDGMGRAFPEVQMSTFFIYGLDPSPGAIADDKGNVVVFKTVVDMFWLERFARHIAVDMGAAAGFATAPMKGAYVKKDRGSRHVDAGARDRTHDPRRARQAPQRRRAVAREDRGDPLLHRQSRRRSPRAEGWVRHGGGAADGRRRPCGL